MAKLIDANEIPYHKSGFPKGDGFDSRLDWAFREDIDKLPTVDAVEVVRCRDCKHSECYDALLYCGHTRGLAGSVAPNNFCSYGERKDGEGNGC